MWILCPLLPCTTPSCQEFYSLSFSCIEKEHTSSCLFWICHLLISFDTPTLLGTESELLNYPLQATHCSVHPYFIHLSADCFPVHLEAHLGIQNLLHTIDHITDTSLNLNSTIPDLTWEIRSADRMHANYSYVYSSTPWFCVYSWRDSTRGLLSCMYHFIHKTCQKL